MKSCENCGTLTPNPKFCSRSCSAKITNKVPRRKRTKSRYDCKSCGVSIPHSRSYCSAPKCQPTYVDWSKVTVADVQSKAKYQSSATLRALARKAYTRSGGAKTCYTCGYDMHVDVCHIKAISDFPPNTPVSEVNTLANLVALCKNHHWELDHGFLDLLSN